LNANLRRLTTKTLDFVTSTTNASGFWPPVFSTIPAFFSTIPGPETFGTPPEEDSNKSPSPSPSTPPTPYRYMRGLAPFLDLDGTTEKTATKKLQATPNPKYDPYLCLRLRSLTTPFPPSKPQPPPRYGPVQTDNPLPDPRPRERHPRLQRPLQSPPGHGADRGRAESHPGSQASRV